VAVKDSVQLKIISEIHDTVNLNYVTRAKIYPDDPDSLYLTMRGDPETNTGGGISVYNVANSREPVFLSHLNVADSVPGETINPNQLEGQDRIGNTLVLIALEAGIVHVVDASDPSQLRVSGSIALQGVDEGLGFFPALHTKIYKPSDSNKTYALVTSSKSSKLVAVDISDPENPRQVSELQTGISDLEGLYVKGSYVYCGGFQSDVFLTVDLTDIEHMRLSNMLKKSYYNNMIAELDVNDDDILFVSSYMERKGYDDKAPDRGGLIVFDISQPDQPVEISQVILPELAGSNRVKVHEGYAYLPIEPIEKDDGLPREPGGIGIVNVSDPHHVVFNNVIKSTEAIKPYALVCKDNYLYVMGSESNTLVVKEIIKGNT